MSDKFELLLDNNYMQKFKGIFEVKFEKNWQLTNISKLAFAVEGPNPLVTFRMPKLTNQ